MMERMTKATLVALIALGVSFAGCTKQQEEAPEDQMAETGEMSDSMNTMESTMPDKTAKPMAMMRTAVAEMSPTEGNEASGTVTFTEVEGGIRVVAHFEHVPEGEHGFHIHEFGDCTAPDGSTAGGHFNPDDMPHASRDASQRHVGDLGNITANADGVAEKNFVDNMLSFGGGHSILGKGVILHAKADDLKTQPTGNAGARLACGVVELKDMPMTNK